MPFASTGRSRCVLRNLSLLLGLGGVFGCDGGGAVSGSPGSGSDNGPNASGSAACEVDPGDCAGNTLGNGIGGSNGPGTGAPPNNAGNATGISGGVTGIGGSVTDTGGRPTGAGGSATNTGGNPVGVGGSATGSGGTSGGGASGEDAPPAGDPRVATVATPIDLIPAPGLAGPALKVDLDMSGRPTGEVTEPGYVAWPVTAGGTLSQSFRGITFTFTKTGSNGTELTAAWQKAAVQAPHYARLVGDGLTVSDGNSGSEVQLTIAGLPGGEHSLLTWHNVTGSGTAGSVDVSVEGGAAVVGLTQSANVLSNVAAPSSYVTFTVQAGADVVVRFSSSATLQINGFELDTPDVTRQAVNPTPTDGDEHVDADSGDIELSWTAASQAVSHDVYFGFDPNVVQSATPASAEFKGNQTGASYGVSNLNNIGRYYWRVDEVDAQGERTRGNVWYFRPRHLAFPGAEGHGRFAIGGRGGVVVHVTNLNDTGPGSFRDAIETDRGPRTIVFDVSGVVQLGSRLSLNQHYVTVAGQTAPGKGIVFRSAPFGMSGAHDVIVRHVRVRVGSGTTYDGMGLAGSDHAIVDHSSISWTIDEAFSSRSGKNITLQRTLISECLNIAGHANYPAGTKHGYAASIGGDIGSFHHNLLAHCEGRNWSLAGGLDANGEFAGRLDIFNNVVYNWGGRTTDGGSHQVNFVNNYYRPGPATTIFSALKADYDEFPGTQQYYCAGNVMPGTFDENSQDEGCVRGYGEPQGYSPWVDTPWFPSHAEIHTARDAFKNVLSDVGNTSPQFDDHDIRVVNETLTGTTTYEGSESGVPGLPDSETDVGGYEDYPNENRDAGWDSDGDGLPDWWETDAGLNPASPSGDFSEANTDRDGDGYTELEKYLAFMAAPHHFTTRSEPVSVDLEGLFAGYTSNPSYTLDDSENGTVALSGTTATFTPDRCGHARFALTVTDDEGDSMTRDVLVFVDAGAGDCP